MDAQSEAALAFYGTALNGMGRMPSVCLNSFVLNWCLFISIKRLKTTVSPAGN
jgi:hypothetical protein